MRWATVFKLLLRMKSIRKPSRWSFNNPKYNCYQRIIATLRLKLDGFLKVAYDTSFVVQYFWRYFILKKTWGKNFILVFSIVDFIEKEPSTKFCDVNIIFHEVVKLQSFSFILSDVISALAHNIWLLLLLHIFLNFMENESLKKFFDVFDHFLKSYEVTKFWIFRRCLDESCIVHVNKHT